MKKILLVLMIVPFIYACKKELSASDYLILHQEEIKNLNKIFNESRDYIAKKEIEKAEELRIELVKQSEKSLKKIERLEAHEEGGFLKVETLSLIKFYKDLSSSNHRELIHILRKDNLELVDDVRVNHLNADFDKLYSKLNERWRLAKIQYERMYKVNVS